MIESGVIAHDLEALSYIESRVRCLPAILGSWPFSARFGRTAAGQAGRDVWHGCRGSVCGGRVDRGSRAITIGWPLCAWP